MASCSSALQQVALASTFFGRVRAELTRRPGGRAAC
jgi:hypothetical protein